MFAVSQLDPEQKKTVLDIQEEQARQGQGAQQHSDSESDDDEQETESDAGEGEPAESEQGIRRFGNTAPAASIDELRCVAG
jgi:hypothetical protein